VTLQFAHATRREEYALKGAQIIKKALRRRLECIGAVVVEVGSGFANAAQARHIELVPVVSGGRRRRRQYEACQERAARIGTDAGDSGVAIGQREHIGTYVVGQFRWTRLEDEAWRRARIYRPRTGGADVVRGLRMSSIPVA
jgi:hypothetical protein